MYTFEEALVGHILPPTLPYLQIGGTYLCLTGSEARDLDVVRPYIIDILRPHCYEREIDRCPMSGPPISVPEAVSSLEEKARSVHPGAKLFIGRSTDLQNQGELSLFPYRLTEEEAELGGIWFLDTCQTDSLGRIRGRGRGFLLHLRCRFPDGPPKGTFVVLNTATMHMKTRERGLATARRLAEDIFPSGYEILATVEYLPRGASGRLRPRRLTLIARKDKR